MIKTRAFAALNAQSPLTPFSFERRDPNINDVVIDILYCGVCHSDIHQARNEWGGSAYPMVPGHEIIGKVSKVGSKVSSFSPGDLVGVGCFVDSCRSCTSCKEGLEQYCEGGMSATYNGLERDGKTATQGGYSNHIVVDEKYVLRIPANLDLKGAAPLLCAGITTYSPLKHFGVKAGDKVAVVGLGGLGHMAVKLAKAMGAEVSVLSTSRSKEADAKRLGATHFYATREEGTFEKIANTFDFVLDAVSASHDYTPYLNSLKRDGTMVLLGVPEQPAPVHAFSLIMKRRKLVGSLIGGIAETQEMLNFCGKHGIVSDVEVIPVQKINEAYERTIKGDVRYRFVIDMASL